MRSHFSGREIPRKLYRYRSDSIEYLDSELRAAIIDQKVWVSSYSDLNDPFDMSPVFVHDKPIVMRKLIEKFQKKHPYKSFSGRDLLEEGKRRGVSSYKAKKTFKPSYNFAKIAQKAIREAFYEDRKNNIVCCFSEVFDSIMMWSHYSSSHCGYCFEFELSEEVDIAPPHLSIDRVVYQENRPILRDIEIVHWLGFENFGDSEIFDKEIADQFLQKRLLTKSITWSYEREWRAIWHGNRRDYRTISPMRVSKIILGANATKELEESINAHALGKVPVVRLRVSRGKFGLEPASEW